MGGSRIETLLLSFITYAIHVNYGYHDTNLFWYTVYSVVVYGKYRILIYWNTATAVYPQYIMVNAVCTKVDIINTQVQLQ